MIARCRLACSEDINGDGVCIETGVSGSHDMGAGGCGVDIIKPGDPVLLLTGLVTEPRETSEISDWRLEGSVEEDDETEAGERSDCVRLRFFERRVASPSREVEPSVVRASFLAIVALRAAALLLAAALRTSLRWPVRSGSKEIQADASCCLKSPEGSAASCPAAGFAMNLEAVFVSRV